MTSPFRAAVDRRRLLLLLAAGTAGALGVTGCSEHTTPKAAGSTPPPPSPTTAAAEPGPAASLPKVYPTGPVRPLPPVPAGQPGPPVQVSRLPPGSGQRVALTIDDGYAPDVVAAYVEFARATGIPITFNPNGRYASAWTPHAQTLRPLVQTGQVQIGNHTFSHGDMRRLPEAKIREELERNEQWVVSTFGITSRPWYRPPYGYHDAHSDGVAASVGWTRIVTWNGTLGDATLLTPEALMANARQWFQPGTIMLGHANHPTVTGLYSQILELLQSRHLEPVTLDAAFGTSRATGT